MSEQVLYAVWRNTDDTEGRGKEWVAHLCRKLATAKRLAHRKYVQGGDCPITEVRTIRSVDGRPHVPLSMFIIEEPTLQDELDQKRIDAKQAAIEKARAAGLTDEEITALSLR